MITRRRLDEYRDALDELSRRAQTDLRATFELWLPDGLDVALAEVKRQAASISDVYGDMAATLAAEFFEQTAFDETGVYLDAQLADPYDYDALEANIQYAQDNHLSEDNLDIDGFLSAISNVMDGAVKGAARATTATNTWRYQSTGVRYARVPTSPNPCAFCIMLAGRGFAYSSAASAEGYDKYHNNCSCEAVASWSGDVEGYDSSYYEKMYFDARASAGSGDAKAILAEMRRMLPSDVCGDHVDADEAE